MPTKPKHGGKRTGAGRRPEPTGKRVAVIATVSPATRERLIALTQARGLSLGRLLDERIDAL